MNTENKNERPAPKSPAKMAFGTASPESVGGNINVIKVTTGSSEAIRDARMSARGTRAIVEVSGEALKFL